MQTPLKVGLLNGQTQPHAPKKQLQLAPTGQQTVVPLPQLCVLRQVQAPLRQTSLLWQPWPQLPQLATSVWALTQVLPQQISFEPQAWPQLPQLVLSLVVSTQEPEQDVSSVGQTQLPFEQLWPAGH
jgi:hypothetical protein